MYLLDQLIVLARCPEVTWPASQCFVIYFVVIIVHVRAVNSFSYSPNKATNVRFHLLFCSRSTRLVYGVGFCLSVCTLQFCNFV